MTLSSSTPEPDTTAKGKLAKHLRRIRQSAGFATMPPLARRLGVSPDLISKIETGKHVPTMDIFLAWLEACEVTEEPPSRPTCESGGAPRSTARMLRRSPHSSTNPYWTSSSASQRS